MDVDSAPIQASPPATKAMKELSPSSPSKKPPSVTASVSSVAVKSPKTKASPKTKVKKSPAKRKTPSKRKKFVEKPQKPLTAYFDWMRTSRGTVQIDESSGVRRNKQLAEMWKSMSETDKKPFLDRYNERKAAYDKKMVRDSRVVINPIHMRMRVCYFLVLSKWQCE